MKDNNKTFDFSYKDNEGDLFESNDHKSEGDARREIARLRKRYDGDLEIIETWIYQGDEFKGRW